MKIFSRRCKKLKIENVHDLYEKYVSKAQVNFKSFAFGNDLIEKRGSFLTLERKILDLTEE